MFVWVFHRVSGVLLIFLLALQLVSGVFQGSISNQPLVKAVADLHRDTSLILLTSFLLIFHAAFGVRTILMDCGLRRERALFWWSSGFALAAFIAFAVFYFSVVVP